MGSQTIGITDNVYAAVLTIENVKASQMNIHVVPGHWMKDNVLFYPPDSMGKTTIEGIIKAGRFAAIDMKKWKKYAFIVKKRFKSFDSANSYVNERQQTDDTDENDDAQLEQLKKAQANINRERRTKGKQQLPLSNYFVEQLVQTTLFFNGNSFG
jgi:hypothetical protein